MSWILPSVISCLAGSAVLTWVYAFLYLQYRERHMALWAWGWGCYVLRFVLLLLSLTVWPGEEIEHFIQLSVLASGYLLFLGTAAFLDREAKGGWLVGLAGGVFWVFWSRLADLPFFAANFPVYTFYGLISTWTGLLLLRSREAGRSSRLVTGWALVLWGLHKLDYPFLRPVSWFAPWGFLLGAVLSFVVAVGMLLVYFQRMRRELLTQEEALRLSEEKFRASFDQTFQLTGLLSPDGTLLEVNRTALKLIKAEAGQVVGRPFWETPWWNGAPERQEMIRQAVGTAAAGELVRLHTDHGSPDEVMQIDFSLKPVTAPDGKILFLIAEGRDITALKDSETRLRAALEKLEALFSASPSPIIVMDEEHHVQEWNPAAERIFGWQRDEVLGRPYNLVPPGYEHEFFEIKNQVVNGQCLYRGDVVRKTKDGVLLDISVSVAPLFDSQKQLIAIIAILEDITERKAALHRIQVQNNLLSNILTTIPYAVFWKDSNSFFLGCNTNFARHAGLDSPEQIIGLTDFHLPWKPEEAAFYRQCDAEVMAKGEALLDIEETQNQADGRQATLLTSKVPLRSDSGQIIGLLGMYSDITDRKQATDALRQSEKKYRQLSQEYQALLDGIPDVLILFSPELNVVWANKSAEESFNQGRETLPGQSCNHLWEVHGAPCDPCMVFDCFSWGRVEERKVKMVDGRIWGTKTFPISDASGHVVNVIVWATEISEKIRLREETMHSSRLASLGELAAGMAHEINNPTGLILLNLPVLIDSYADALPVLEAHFRQNRDFTLGGFGFQRMREEIPEILDEVQEAALRIKRIVEDLKNFARQDNLEQADAFDLNAAAQAAVRLLGNAIKNSTDRFTAVYAESLPPISGNFQRIEQVVVNLLMNACQALPEKERGIFLATRFDAASRMNIVEIRDEGVGIHPELLPNVTNPFFTTRRQRGGTGLGLSISARIVKDHCGRLDFESAPGQGTVVTLCLPVQLEET